MRITLATTGSSGDVQPFISLGIQLAGAGHHVKVAAPENARNLCRRCGLEFTAIDSDTQSRLRSESRRVPMDSGNSLRFTLQRLKSRRNIALNVNRAVWLACQDAELIIYRIGGFIYAESVAEKLNIPAIKVGLVPYTPTRSFPSLYFSPILNLGSLGNLMSHYFAQQFIWLYMHQVVNDFRRKVLGLQPYPVWKGSPNCFTNKPGKNDNPVLYAFSQVLVPKPPDWGEKVHITGHWSPPPEKDWEPPKELLRFLDEGEPPIFLGFGSMITRKPEEILRIACEALNLSKQRGIIASGWNALEGVKKSNDRFYLMERVPHDWLFPRTAAVVHHGGVGTTITSLKAGVPTIAIPFTYDQPFWGMQIHRLGVGPRPIPRKELTAERLADAIITSIESDTIRSSVEEISKKLKSEDGTGYSARVIENYLAER